HHPYYFIEPQDQQVKREFNLISHTNKKHNDNKLYSGRILCKLITKGPLFIPDTNTNSENSINFNQEIVNEHEKDNLKHKNYTFFRINDRVTIPGSSIRGMVSSVFETLTNSCFRVMDEKKYLTRRTIPDIKSMSNQNRENRRLSTNHQYEA
ncbi:CRISPR-associated protein, partial [Candidatus Magnetomorum sp. HK-1]